MMRRCDDVSVRIDDDGPTFRVHAEDCPDGRPHGERGVASTSMQCLDELPGLAKLMTQPRTGVEVIVEPCLDGLLPSGAVYHARRGWVIAESRRTR